MFIYLYFISALRTFTGAYFELSTTDTDVSVGCVCVCVQIGRCTFKRTRHAHMADILHNQV